MKRDYYSSSIANFLKTSTNEILGSLVRSSGFTIEQTQRDAWLEEIAILKNDLSNIDGTIYFEYSIPRMGKRIDTVLLIGSALFVLEFKIGEREFTSYAMDQAYDYALDLKNFHETSRELLIAPIVLATNALAPSPAIATTVHDDKVLAPMRCTIELLPGTLRRVLEFAGDDSIDPAQWEQGRYSPTPTIIEAAMALYNSHAVDEISRSDAAAINLSVTSAAISEIIQSARDNSFKAVCFVTGVPGAGKTLVGLNIATQRRDESDDLYSVFLSGNKPLVDILRTALARDRIRRDKEAKRKTRKGQATSEVKAFIQNVHHFRDECIIDKGPPKEHVALFDEAQRAWDLKETASFMHRKKSTPNFNKSEPEYLISCLNRHPDWAGSPPPVTTIPVMSLDIVELIAGGGCNPLSKKLHALFTAYHPYLATLNLFLEGPAPLPATINPAISANGEADSPGGGQLIDSGLKPCAYILWGSPPH